MESSKEGFLLRGCFTQGYLSLFGQRGFPEIVSGLGPRASTERFIGFVQCLVALNS